jgi:phosphoribosylglycinamide formyltransferase 1
MRREALRTVVLVSGSGSNLEALLKAHEASQLPDVQFVGVISSRPGVLALERARKWSIPSHVVDPTNYPTVEATEEALLSVLTGAGAELICLAGYLRKLGPRVIDRYRGRILNIHPALLPKYGGAGMWGHHVHEAVLAAGDADSGCTVHLVDEEFDHGAVVAQARVPVLPGDSPDTLAARILEQEHRLFPNALKAFSAQLRAQL